MAMSAKTLALATLFVATSTTTFASAQESEATNEPLCNPVIDGGGNAVRAGDGDVVRSSGTFVCPPEVGLVEEVVVVVEPVVISIDGNVAFDFDKAVIKPEFFGELDEIIAILNEAPDSPLLVIGHTDSIGSEAYNQGLSERRAEAVATYLRENGLDSSHLGVEGKGETQPIASNETKEGRAKNRRVEIRGLVE